jgi:anti-sigma factor RsiW
MKTLVPSLLAAGILAAGTGFALADTVVIAPAQQKVIHEYVVQQDTAPVVLPSDTMVEVGTVVPDTVEIHQLAVPDLQVQYDYMVVNGQTVLVDPQTRKIVQIIH